ncbi:MAG: recombinase family protein [Clostridium perfringens]|uniref:recombinase family protein n=1 Tax=Veillonella sp. TaxID=1926307 RepID=UPI0028FE08DA|nr:recombinase family protein [Veillonella sp.]MDU2094788.1 recombinase family protein [Clostridium perfringens]MDU2102694.1 recombinase family protein [Veillonella sp.]
MKVGYIRVSTKEQNTIRQEKIMSDLGVDRVYIEKVSGATKEREQLKLMIDFVREGDTVIVESISRFARNTKDLLELTEILDKKGVQFISKKETIDTSTPTGKFMLTVFGAVAQLERDYIKERQAEGIAIAKEQGKYKGRKKIKQPSNFEEVYNKWKVRELTATKAMELLELKRNTFYKLVQEYEEKNK